MPNYLLTVNWRQRSVEVHDSDEPLLFVLRNQLGLTGAKYGCGLIALANAVFDASAVRLRTVPFAPERVLAGLA